MRRTLVILLSVLLGLYVLLHLLLGSSPVQKRVLSEIRTALSAYGIDLQIESIEFSALTPKIYLNRVTLSTNSRALLKLPTPLAIDKVKIQFQPLSLIYRKITIDEATLFHPRIIVPRADVLYRKIETLIKDRSRVSVDTGDFSVVVNKFGVVDALINIASEAPPLEIRSNSLSAFVAINAREQQTITVESTNLDVVRGPLKVLLSKVDFDADFSEKSLRVNKGIVEGDSLTINVIGASSLPFKDKGPDSFNASFDVELPLAILNQVPELKTPNLAGSIKTNGTINAQRGRHRGNGGVLYRDLGIDGYRFGSGQVNYAITDNRLDLTDAQLKYAGGEVLSSGISIELRDRFAISGLAKTRDVRLESILDSVKSYHNPIRLPLTGEVKIDGYLAKPFSISLDTKQSTKDFLVLKEDKRDTDHSNVVLRVPELSASGKLGFTKERMTVQAEVSGLEGKMQVDGFVGFDEVVKIKARSDSFSLTGLEKIAQLKIGGKVGLTVDVDVIKSAPKITGRFEATDAEIADLVLGKVTGLVQFQNLLLSFENLDMMAMEPVRGSGFVDFKPKKTHYKFMVDARRVGVDEAFSIFKKRKLKFEVPQMGEVINGKVSIEGGHDSSEIEVLCQGQARNFKFFDEKWLSSQFSVTYRDSFTDLNRVLLFKKRGGVEVKGRFTEASNSLSITSRGLRIEELDSISRAPLSGEVVGQMTLEGDLKAFPPKGRGEVRISNMTFRGAPVSESSVRFQSEGDKMLFIANVVGEKLRGRYVRPSEKWERGVVSLSFNDFDFAPLLTLAIGKDIPTITEVLGSGEMSFTGNLREWATVNGNGVLSQLRLGLRGTPMQNKSPLEIKIENGSVKFEKFQMVGTDSQLAMEYRYEPNHSVKASLDGKLDLQFLQPFIPGLEYGAGKVSVGLRMSGHPSRFELLGNVTLDDGIFRLQGLSDDFRSVQAQISVGQDRLNIDRFESLVGGGRVRIYGDVGINRFRSLSPNLRLATERVTMRFKNSLSTMFSGDFSLKGNQMPYLLSGVCKLHEGALTKFDTAAPVKTASDSPPVLAFDVTCEAKERLQVTTDVMNAEFRGNFHVLGTSDEIGLLGNVDAIKGAILFRETPFTLNSGTVKFESPTSISPRFNVSGRAVVREAKSFPPQDYEITLQVFGTPADYKIRLTSSPSLAESDITSLLILGVTSRGGQALGQEGNYADLGTAIAGQIPLQSKFQSELGLDIKINTQTVRGDSLTSSGAATSAGAPQFSSVPSVQIQKGITKSTKLSFSNSLGLGETIPVRELKIEHALDENFTINGTAVDRARTETQSSKSYGLDFRYRFSFE